MKSLMHGSRILAAGLTTKELYRARDAYGEVVVSQRGGKRVMNFFEPNADKPDAAPKRPFEQSSVLMDKPYYLGHEYTKMMLLGLIYGVQGEVQAKSPHGEAWRMTLLGLGGGGLVHCMQHFFPACSLEVVELRQLVIDIARRCFELPTSPQLSLHCSEALQYLQSARAHSTDYIFSDLYDASGMSAEQGCLAFIEASERVLSEQGVLVLNFHELPGAASNLMGAILARFPQVFVCDVFSGNRVLFCCKSTQAFDAGEMKSRARKLVKRVDMPLMFYFKKTRPYSS